MFHNFPVPPFTLKKNAFSNQNVDHMFTNFYSYHKDNTIYNISFFFI